MVAQGGGQRREVVDGGFATGDDDEFRARLGGLLGEGFHFHTLNFLRDEIGVPGPGGVAPGTMHRATEEPDEKRRAPQMAAFALPGVESLVNRQLHDGR